MQFVLILIWFVLISFVANRICVKQEVSVNGVKEQRYSWIFAFLAFLPVILMAGLRGDFVDTSVYRNEFVHKMPSAFSELSSYMDSVPKDKGFFFLSSLIKIIFGNNDILYFLLIASFQGIIVLSIFRRYSTNYVLSIFLFVISTDYVSWMFNGIRQFMAVTIIFAFTTLLISKKYIPLILVILLASTMHQSALLMLPIVFIVQGEAWNKKTLLFISLIILSIFFLGTFTTMLDNFLTDTQYRSVMSDIREFNDDGTHPIRVIVYSIPTVISFYGRNKIKDSNKPIINLCTNMSIVSTGLYIISMFVSGTFLGRLPIYTSLFNYILLPWEIDNIISEKWKTATYFLLIVGYCAFYYYQMHMVWGLI